MIINVDIDLFAGIVNQISSSELAQTEPMVFAHTFTRSMRICSFSLLFDNCCFLRVQLC